jgi:hypothetical protein
MLIAILSLLLVVVVSILITRLAAMALVLTGMSKESATFQARSAFSGVGFTTREAESVVSNPVRRRIVMLLMLAGSIGVPMVVATLVISFMTTIQADRWWWPVLMLVSGLLALGLATRSRWISERVNGLLLWGLRRWTDLDVRDYISLLQLQNGYAVNEMVVEYGDWLAGKTLREAALSHEGVLVLGIQQADGLYLGTPRAGDEIRPGDMLILYGRADLLKELDGRAMGEGELAHRTAIAVHTSEMAAKRPPI